MLTIVPDLQSIYKWPWRLIERGVAGDTGGIVESDWATINWNKITYMTSIGLNPWYRGGASATPVPV